MLKQSHWRKLQEISSRLNNISDLEEGIQILKEAEILFSKNVKIKFYHLVTDLINWVQTQRILKNEFPVSVNDYINREASSFWGPKFQTKETVHYQKKDFGQYEYLKQFGNSEVQEIICQPVIENEFVSWCLEIHNFGEFFLTETDLLIAQDLASKFAAYWGKLRYRGEKSRREIQIKKLFELSTEPELPDLLKRVVDEMPGILRGEGCSIFLIPHFFPNSISIQKDVQREIEGEEDKVVVLAATNGLNDDLIGKAYYKLGEGITGWIAMHGVSLNLGDVSDPKEREAVARREAEKAGSEYTPIGWTLKFNESQLPREVPRPFLGVPIKSPKTSKIIGVLRLCALKTTARWTGNYEMMLSGYANLLGERIERDYITGALLRILNEGDIDTLLNEIANRAHRLVNGSGCSIFMQNEEDPDQIIIKASTLSRNDWEGRDYRRNGAGCTAWVFTKGRPINLTNIQDSEELERIAPKLNWSGIHDKGHGCESTKPGPFLAVPIQVEGETKGVIRIPRDADAKAFTNEDLEIVETLAGQVSLVLEWQLRLDKRHQLKEEERNRVINLYKLGSRMQEEHYNLDRLCHLFLTGITHGDVLGINRAVLFKYEPELRRLKGIMALGPADRKEAIRYKAIVENTPLSLEKCIKEFDRQGGPIVSNIQEKIWNNTFDLAINCQCMNLIENRNETIVELNISNLSRSLASFIQNMDAEKAISFILPVTPDRTYLVICDNLYIEPGVDDVTTDLLKLYIDQSLLAFQRVHQEEEMRVVKENVWRVVSEIAAHRLGHLLPIVDKRLSEMMANKNGSINSETLKDTRELVVRSIEAISHFKRIAAGIDVNLDQRFFMKDLLEEFKIFLKQGYRDVKIEYDFSTHLESAVIAVDLNNLKSCIETLFDNAKDNKPEGLMIKINCYKAPLEEIGKFKLSSEYAYSVIAVEDNGTGVREDLKQKIFDPFFTTKSRGSGVGLTMVREVLEKHGGKVVEDGKFGRSALFKLFLPIYRKGV